MQIPIISRRGQAKPWTSIPRINWGHPLANKLVSYCYDAGGGVTIDLVSGAKGTRVSTATNTAISVSTSYIGQAWKYAAQGGATGAETNHIEFPNSSNVNNLANAVYSAACGFIATASSTSGLDAAIFGCTDSGQNDQFLLGVFNSPPMTAEVSFSNTPLVLGSLTVALNQYATIAMSLPSTTGNIYTVQGSNFQKDTQTGLSFTPLTGQQPMFADFEQGNATSGHFCNFNGLIFYGAAWKRVIAADEVRSLHDDPWQFLIYPEDEIFATLVGAASAPEFIGPDKYMQALSEPQRSKPNLGASQPFGALVPAAPFGENINPDKWYQALSEPQRQKLGLSTPLQSFASSFVFTPGVVFEFIGPDKYMQALSEPQRFRTWVRPSDQPFLFTPAGTPEFIGPDKYMQALSEPQRRKLGLNASAQSFFAFEPALLPIFGWYEALSDPVRFARLSPALAPFEPFLFTPPPAVPVNFWYQPLSEPQRNKLWLKAALQEAWVGPPRLLPTFMFAVMNAVEQFDTFLGGGTAFNTPASAEIGIVFNPYPAAQVGIAQPSIASVSISIAAPSS